MIADVKPYSAMKDSGVPWLGEIPEHWDLKPGRACYLERKVPNTGLREKTVLSLSYGRIVVKPGDRLHGLVPESFETYQLIAPGDIVVRPTDLQNDRKSLRFGIARDQGIITSAYLCLRTTSGVAREYGYLLLHAYDLKKVFYGLGSGLRQNLDWNDFKHLPCLVPPPSEQSSIVRFLDYADARIRRYIRAKQQLIKLLEEQKQAVVHRAITRGPDPNVALKPSDVEWLGDIPEHWDAGRLKTRLILNDGGAWGSDFSEAGTIVLRSTEQTVDGGWNIVAPARRLLSDRERQTTLLRAGDLVVTKSSGSAAHIGKTSVVMSEIEKQGCGFSNFMQRLRPRPDTDPFFLWYCMNSRVGREQLVYLSNSTTGLGNLSGTILGNMWLAFPPLAEQMVICSEIAKRTRSQQRAIERSRNEIALLKEYRSRLIADVVTGKRDVRDAARLVDEVGEDDVDEDLNAGADDLHAELEEVEA